MLDILFNYPQRELVELGITPKGLIVFEFLKNLPPNDWEEINGYLYYKLDYLKIADGLPILQLDSLAEIDLILHQLMSANLISLTRSNKNGLMQQYFRMGENYELLI